MFKVLFLFFSLIPSLVLGQLMTERDKQIHYAAGAFVSTVTYDIVYKKTKSRKKAFLYSNHMHTLICTLKNSMQFGIS